MPNPQTRPRPMLDFEAIADFWFGDLPEPESPFKPVEPIKTPATPEILELVSPLDHEEEPEVEEQPEDEETPEPE